MAENHESEAVSEPEPSVRRVISVSGTNSGIVATGDANIQINNFPVPRQEPGEDPREVFLADVRELALSEAKSVSLLSRIFMTAGAGITMFGGLLAVLSLGGAAGLSTALGGLLVGTCGGAFALQSKRSHERLVKEAQRVSEHLHLDQTREEALALIARIEDRDLRDRLHSITIMRTLGLAPPAQDAAQRIFATQIDEQRQIERDSSRPAPLKDEE